MAQTIFIAGGPKRGIPTYVMKKFDFVKMLESIQKFKITTLNMVPPVVVVRRFPHFDPFANYLPNLGTRKIPTVKEVRPQQCS